MPQSVTQNSTKPTRKNLGQRCEQAKRLAKKQYFYQAVEEGQAIFQQFQKMPWIQQAWTDLRHGGLIEDIEDYLPLWQQEIAQMQTLARRAEDYEKEGKKGPDLSPWIALGIYEQCEQRVKDGPYQEGRDRCHKAITQRHTFTQLIAEADTWADQSFFKQAKAQYQKAQAIFSTDSLTTSIQRCNDQLSTESLYEQALELAHKLARSGKFDDALGLAKTAHQDFPRSDGAEFIQQLTTTINIESLMRDGLAAEQDHRLTFPAISAELTTNHQLSLVT